MLNSKPNNKKYRQGNYIPKNKDKIIKLNHLNGLFYRSGLELKMMHFLDNNPNIIRWGAECLIIPYKLTHFENGNTFIKNHCYYPDFYYELKLSNGEIKHVVAEVKPQKEYEMVLALDEGRLQVPEKGTKKLKNFEYDFKLADKNRSKFNTMIKWCNAKGYEFIIITEQHLKGN